MKKCNKKLVFVGTVCILILISMLVAFFANGNISKIPIKSNTTNEVSTKEETSERVTQLNEHIMKVDIYSDMLYDFSDAQVLSELSDYIAIIRVDSVDGVTNINRKLNKPVIMPFTYGSASVLQVIKGSVPDEVSYIRSGGMMTYDKWVEGQNNPDKLKALKADSDLADIPPEDILVDCNMENDINIEVGKIYLAFMCRNDSSNFENEYVIQGFQYGLRELQEPNSAAAAQSAVELKVKNNMTGAWESIGDIVYLGEPQKILMYD